MAKDDKKQKTIVIGAGPVGALAALYAAQRGHEVEIYELRGDLRSPSTTPLNFTKSINLALSQRGITAMRDSGRPNLFAKVSSETIPMRGRMIHGSKGGELYESPQDYDIHGRTIFAVDRGGLNRALLEELESMPNVKFFFNHKLTGADFKGHKAWFETSVGRSTKKSVESRDQEVEVEFDFLIGADGAHSAARYHLMKYVRMDYQQAYIDTLWCEFTITAKKVDDPNRESAFRISPHHLHIWPGKEFMFIAIPSLDGSFTCTLFLPSSHFTTLEKEPSSLPNFFDANFPGVTSFIQPSDLIASFTQNPHLPLINIKCRPYHFSDAAVILGDAAHAMLPFYGQGMNAGLEDVRVLFSILDKHAPESGDIQTIARHRAEALAEYSEFRQADAHAINDLAHENYIEMRASVVSPVYKLRKFMEERISVYLPSLEWKTKYSRVSFGNERYSEVVRLSERQGRLLLIGLVGAITGPVVLGGLLVWGGWRRGQERFLEWRGWMDALRK